MCGDAGNKNEEHAIEECMYVMLINPIYSWLAKTKSQCCNIRKALFDFRLHHTGLTSLTRHESSRHYALY